MSDTGGSERGMRPTGIAPGEAVAGGTVERVYLDWNACAPLHPDAREAMIAAFDLIGNPSSVHREGRAARALVEEARARVGALAGVEPARIVFTSGGTEANVAALSPDHRIEGRPAGTTRLIVSAVEHPSVMAGGRFPADRVSVAPVDAAGRIDLARLEAMIAAETAAGGRVMVSLMAANNETGIIQPVVEAARLVHARGGLLHVDAVQAAGRMKTEAGAFGADLVSLSAHKIGGPKGIGALVVARSDLDPAPLITGGGQEFRRRAGTEAVPAIAGFGAAAAAAQADHVKIDHIRALRDWLERELVLIYGGTVVFSSTGERLPGTTCFAIRGMAAETAMIALDLAGIAVSSGAACSSGKVAPSHVLLAMDVDAALAKAALRISLGAGSTRKDVERFVAAWRGIIGRFLAKGGPSTRVAANPRELV